MKAEPFCENSNSKFKFDHVLGPVSYLVWDVEGLAFSISLGLSAVYRAWSPGMGNWHDIAGPRDSKDRASIVALSCQIG